MHIRGAVVVVAATLALAGCAAQSATGGQSQQAGGENAETKVVSVQREVDPSQWCGDKKLKVGVADGFGGNAWRQVSLEVVRREVAKCSAVDPNILYTNANGDAQKASSDIASQVSQGVNLLIVYPDFGAAELPALRAAKKAGVTVIAYDSDPGGKIGLDYDAKVVMGGRLGGEDLGSWMGKTLPSGNVVFLGGIPGAPTSLDLLSGIKSSLDGNSKVKLLLDEPVTTNWNKVDTQKAVNGLLAKYPQIDGVITDYGVTAAAAIDAFVAAGKPVPAIATVATSNELGCLHESLTAKGSKFPIYTLDSTNDMAQLALRLGVGVANGKVQPENQTFKMPTFIDSTAGKMPPCDPTLPPDADFSSPLTVDQLKAVLSK